MGRRGWQDLDESDVRVRPGRRGSRPRSKQRPRHADAVLAMVIAVDRGRWTCALGNDPERVVMAMRARELRSAPVVGDVVSLVGDVSGRPDTLARIVRVAERESVLRRTADDTDPYERVVVANADQMLIVSSVIDPQPRPGLIDRCLVAAYVGGLEPVLCLTKTDLADPAEWQRLYKPLELPTLSTRIDTQPIEVADRLQHRTSVLIGHSGVGKSTLVNKLSPLADRTIGEVSGVGKGRHTSTSVEAIALGRDSWVIDTPGIRSFGLAHVTSNDLVATFPGFAAAAEECPPNCGHLGAPEDPDCYLDQIEDVTGKLSSLRRLLRSRDQRDRTA